MNDVVVIDASVAVARVLSEEFTGQARAFFDQNLDTGRLIVAPPHFLSEVANAVYQRYRRRDPLGQISEQEADRALLAFWDLPIQPISPPGLYGLAYTFAKQHGVSSVYDALYVVLAQLLEVELWTGDRRLHNTVHQAAPWVFFIGLHPAG